MELERWFPKPEVVSSSLTEDTVWQAVVQEQYVYAYSYCLRNVVGVCTTNKEVKVLLLPPCWRDEIWYPY